LGGILDVSKPIDGTVSFVAKTASGQVSSRLDNIPGTITGGHKECRFEGQLPGSPLNFTVTANSEGEAGPIRFGFDLKRWNGSPILLLPYFDQIAAFFRGVREATGVDLQCFLQGNQLFCGTIWQEDLGVLKSLASFFPVLTQAREISRAAGINPIINEKIDQQKAQDIDYLHKLLTEGVFRREIPGAKISCSLPRAGIRNLLKMPPLLDRSFFLATVESQKIPFLGDKVEVGKLEQEFTHVKLESTKKELRKRLTESKAKQIKVSFVCTEQSELIVQKTKIVPTGEGSTPRSQANAGPPMP